MIQNLQGSSAFAFKWKRDLVLRSSLDRNLLLRHLGARTRTSHARLGLGVLGLEFRHAVIHELWVGLQLQHAVPPVQVQTSNNLQEVSGSSAPVETAPESPGRRRVLGQILGCLGAGPSNQRPSRRRARRLEFPKIGDL